MTELSLCILELSDGRYAFQRRKTTARISGGLIGFFGGRNEAGETPDAAMVRELSEETSLDVASLAITQVGRFELPDSHACVYLYKTHIENANFEDFEGDGVEVYAVNQLLARDDATDIVQALLPYQS